MIGGLLVDLLLVASVAAFGWAGAQLGGLVSIGRTIASCSAVVVAVLLRDPVGSLIGWALGRSDDFSQLVAMLLVGAGTYLAVLSLYRWWLARRVDRRAEAGYDELDYDGLDSPRVGAVAGGILGAGWALLFIAMLVLLPVDNVIARAASRGYVGRAMIRQEGALRWIADGFPHYTQTLPKGEAGAVVGPRESLPMVGSIDPEPVAADADAMLRSFNAMRRNATVRTLTFNPDIARVASRHADALAIDMALRDRTTSGAKLSDRVLAAANTSAIDYSDDVGIITVWAHSPANAVAAILEDPDASKLVADERYTEVGIGAVDAGWFNGRIYVVALVGPADQPDTTGNSATDDTTAFGDGSSAVDGGTDPGPADASAPLDASCAPPVDIDGDGIPDEESIDPALDC